MATHRVPSDFGWAGFLLGFALGGFFDGILLHQILQWHHLLSAINGEDVRFQIAADGYFHALMYAIAAAGLWLLWRSHAKQPADGRLLTANILVGFGVWHIVDAMLSHWLTGIHRIRMDSANPLLWDLLWLVAFGILPLAAGWWLRRAGHRGSARPAVAPCVAALLVIAAGAYALRPSADSPFTTVLFRPGTSAAEALAAVAGIGGRVAWTDASGQVVVFESSGARSPFALYWQGAILVSGSGLPSGCFGWTRA